VVDHVRGAADVVLVPRDQMAVAGRHEVRLDEVGAEVEALWLPHRRWRLRRARRAGASTTLRASRCGLSFSSLLVRSRNQSARP
jgi:hypothetical protein